MSSQSAHLALAVAQYREEAEAAAKAKAAYKSAWAKRKLVAKHSGEASSDAAAATYADADDTIADLYSQQEITAALADATKEKLRSLREDMATARTEMVNERDLDRAHAHDPAVI